MFAWHFAPLCAKLLTDGLRRCAPICWNSEYKKKKWNKKNLKTIVYFPQILLVTSDRRCAWLGWTGDSCVLLPNAWRHSRMFIGSVADDTCPASGYYGISATALVGYAGSPHALFLAKSWIVYLCWFLIIFFWLLVSHLIFPGVPVASIALEWLPFLLNGSKNW